MSPAKKPRIFVADDDPDILKIVVSNLRSEGFDVEAFPDGYQAEVAARRAHPDLMVLDVVMPAKTGLDVLASLRANPETADIPVVLLTARSSDAEVWEGWKAGAAYYITKPFQVEELLQFVKSLFASRTA